MVETKRPKLSQFNFFENFEQVVKRQGTCIKLEAPKNTQQNEYIFYLYLPRSYNVKTNKK